MKMVDASITVKDCVIPNMCTGIFDRNEKLVLAGTVLVSFEDDYNSEMPDVLLWQIVFSDNLKVFNIRIDDGYFVSSTKFNAEEITITNAIQLAVRAYGVNSGKLGVEDGHEE